MHQAGLRRALPGRPGGDGPVFTGGSNRLDHRATLESAVALAVGIWFVLLRYRPACVTSLSQFASAALPLDVSFLYDWHRMYPAAILRHKRDGLPSVLRSIHEGPDHDADSDRQLGRKIGEQGDGPGAAAVDTSA